MKISNHVHQIHIKFDVTNELKRFVNIYLITGKYCYLVDTGVAGSETLIEAYMKDIDRDMSEIKGILLTHSHPDHIGAAADIKAKTGCKVYASRAEAGWIEDIEKQLEERPIPNFKKLLNQSVKVDEFLEVGETLLLEENMHLDVIDVSGHSKGDVAFFYKEEGALFTGDCIPVTGDLIMYLDKGKSIKALEHLQRLKGIQLYCPAWDCVHQEEKGKAAIQEGLACLTTIDL